MYDFVSGRELGGTQKLLKVQRRLEGAMIVARLNRMKSLLIVAMRSGIDDVVERT